MTWFIIGFVVLALVIIVCAFILIGLSKEENKYMEVSNKYLKNIGKDYTKDEFASWAFTFYNQIILSIQHENYNYLRDVLADELYNNYLIGIKNAKSRNIQNVVEDIKPTFSKLVSLVVKDDIEIAKVWLKLSYIEYTKDISPISEENQDSIPKERIIAGSKDRRIEKEYMITLVKGRTEKESVACPNCGFITNIVSQNTCSRCGANVVNRRYHWVMIGKEELRNRN